MSRPQLLCGQLTPHAEPLCRVGLLNKSDGLLQTKCQESTGTVVNAHLWHLRNELASNVQGYILSTCASRQGGQDIGQSTNQVDKINKIKVSHRGKPLPYD